LERRLRSGLQRAEAWQEGQGKASERGNRVLYRLTNHLPGPVSCPGVKCFDARSRVGGEVLKLDLGVGLILPRKGGAAGGGKL
jgi:hypothetical protein